MKYVAIINKEVNENFRDITSLAAYPFVVVITLILMFIDIRKAIILFAGVVLVDFAGTIIKLLFYKKRPNKQRYQNIFEKIESGSFPSIHSGRATVISLNLINMFYSSAILGICLFYVLLIGISRIALKKHYLVDVIAGCILGIFVEYLITLV